MRIASAALFRTTRVLQKSLSIVFLVLLGACYKPAKEITLQCEGRITSIGETVWTKEGEKIALRLKDNTLAFSGNPLLIDKTISICPVGTNYYSGDDIYFDSSGCGDGVKDVKRQYGTYNKILHVFDLEETSSDGEILRGIFDCRKSN